MKFKSLSLCAALLCGVALTSPAPASARRQMTTTDIDGTYVLDDPAAAETIKKAINAAVKGMFGEGIARGRLEKTNLPPYQRIVIRVGVRMQVTDVSITMDQRAPIVTPPDGTPVEWTREDKEKLKVSTTVTVLNATAKVSPIEQTFKSKDGERVNTYTVSGDGKTLTMRVVVSSPRLPRPATYVLKYKRVP